MKTIVFISVADPVHFFGSGYGWPKKTGSDRIRILLKYVYDVKQHKCFFLWHFLTKSKHLMTLKIKDTFIWRENLNYRGLFVDTGSGSGSGIFPDPGPSDSKRPDPTGSLNNIHIIDNLKFFNNLYKQVWGSVRLFLLACARAHADQSKHNSECLTKVFIAYIMNHIW